MRSGLAGRVWTVTNWREEKEKKEDTPAEEAVRRTKQRLAVAGYATSRREPWAR